MDNNITTQILQAIAANSKKINDINNRLDTSANMKYNENKTNITDNSDGLFDVAEILADLESRVAALEDAKNE